MKHSAAKRWAARRAAPVTTAPYRPGVAKQWGRDAAEHKGDPRWFNPFQAGSAAHDEWEAGYNEKK